MKVAVDATYTLGHHLSGVGIYCNELLKEMTRARPEDRFFYCYRPHRFFHSYQVALPPNARRFLLREPLVPHHAELFHGLNQRLPRSPLRRAVTTFHDLFVLTADYSTEEFKARFAEQARHAAEQSDLIIAVSRFTANQVHDLLHVERARVRVVHHGVRFPRGPVTPHLARKPIVLAVGAIQKRKNTLRLVQAFEKTAPAGWKLVLVGSAGFGAEEVLEAIRLSPRGLDIVVKGYVSDEDLAGLYSEALVFAFPSFDEGFGMPVLEAMARGVPVLTSNRSALPEVAGDAALLVDPGQPESIEDGLRTLMTDPVLREALMRKGLERARQFRWENAAAQTWQIYQEVL